MNEKCSKYITHIALVNIVKKTKRTLLSVVATCISVAIIYTSLNLFLNVFTLTKQEPGQNVGNYHYILQTDYYDEINRMNYEINLNTNQYAMYDGKLVNFRTLSQSGNEIHSRIIIEQDDSIDGISVPESMNLHVNDKVTFEVYHSKYNDENIFGINTTQGTTTTHEYVVSEVYKNTDKIEELADGTLFVYGNFASDEEVTNATLIVQDNEIQSSDSIAFTAASFDKEINDIILNQDSINHSKINNYLKDTTTLLAMFVFIITIAIFISIISLKNVFITSDKDRKKEMGLLKSIGATKKDLKKLLSTELSILGFIGSFLGIILGVLVSYVVINMFNKQLQTETVFSMYFNVPLLCIAFFIGFIMLITLGFNSYKQYIVSSPIDDLKEASYNYDPPVHKQSYSSKSFSWKMFLIYNGRLKAQTKNIFISFALLIITTVLFTALFISNLMYEIDVNQIDYDMQLTTLSFTGYHQPNPEFREALYKAMDDKDLIVKDLYIQSNINANDTYFKDSIIDSKNYKYYRSNSHATAKTMEVDGEQYTKIFMTKNLFDERQFEAIAPYVVKGSIDHLDDGGVLLLLKEGDKQGSELFSDLEIGSEVYLGENVKETVEAIAYFNEGDDEQLFEVSSYERCLIMDNDYYLEYGSNRPVETITIRLENPSTLMSSSIKIQEALNTTDSNDIYEFTNTAIIKENNRITSFLIEALFYPLFFMLFIISIMNINNVLIGNIHLKRGDISILKSVGMNSFQLYKVVAFEYAEGYINASALVTAIFTPLCIIESKLGLTSAFSLGENAFATLLISILLIDTIIIVILVVLSLKPLKDIDAIENMKNVT